MVCFSTSFLCLILYNVFFWNFLTYFLQQYLRLFKESLLLPLTCLLQFWNSVRMESFRRYESSGSVRWVVLKKGKATLSLTNFTSSVFGVYISHVVLPLSALFWCFCCEQFANMSYTNKGKKMFLHARRLQIVNVPTLFIAFSTSLMRRKKPSRKCSLTLKIHNSSRADEFYCSFNG